MGYTYVVSDIHGDYDKYMKIFDEVNFGGDDVLYLLGDIVDRGNASCRIMLDAMMRYNVYPIYGNHDLAALHCLKFLNQEITDQSIEEVLTPENMLALQDWLTQGGQSTFDEFTKLTGEEKEMVLEYLEDFEGYAELEVNSKEYVLVHAGIENFDINKPLNEYAKDAFAFEPIDYNRTYFQDKVIVTGHTSTNLIENNPKPFDIYQSNNHIAIDCGCCYGKHLGVIRLDDLKEFYID